MPARVHTVVVDQAGTAVDHGSLGPVGVFQHVFRERGVEVTLAEAREPMGVHKREHIRRVTAMPRVREAWIAVHGGPPTEADIDAMYAAATPAQIAVLPDFSAPIPGALDAIADLQRRGIHVGGTTGYNREMLDVLEAAAWSRHGYRLPVMMSAAEVPAGRPHPYLCWAVATRFGAPATWTCVKVGDTVVDVEAGVRAGFWSVGVACTGNLFGDTAEAWDALDARAQDVVRTKATATLQAAGAHYVVDGLADIGPVIHDIEARLRRGERPA